MATIRLKTRTRKQDSTRLIWGKERARCQGNTHFQSDIECISVCVCVKAKPVCLLAGEPHKTGSQLLSNRKQKQTRSLPRSLHLYPYSRLYVCVLRFPIPIRTHTRSPSGTRNSLPSVGLRPLESDTPRNAPDVATRIANCRRQNPKRSIVQVSKLES